MSEYWIETASGLRLDLVEPRVESILIEDIAHALAHEVRFSGHTERPVSVAEHSLIVCQLVTDRGLPLAVQLGALLHDAQEAYCKDIPRPLKRLLGHTYEQVESRLANLIWSKFGCHNDPAIKWADNVALVSEAQALMANGAKHWGFQEQPLAWVVDGLRLNRQVPAHVHQNRFLRMFRALRAAIEESARG